MTPAHRRHLPVAFLEAEEDQYASGFAVHVHPDAGACGFRGMNPECPFSELFGQWIEVRGHLDDPAPPPAASRQAPGAITGPTSSRPTRTR